MRILKPDLAQDFCAIGAFQTSDGQMIALKLVSNFPHLSFINYKTGRFGALFAVGKQTYQAGPANLLSAPAEITLTFAADFNSLVWEKKMRKSTAKRIAFTEIRTKFPSGSNLLGGMLILPPNKGPFPAIAFTQTSASSLRDADIHSLADDAGDWLATQSTIDVTRIGVWGQSQGGWIAPLAAAKATRFAFVIAQSPNG